jgi:sortase (surface protein transpeptidase)
VHVQLAGAGDLGEAQPQTVAPRPRPGPVMALAVPALDLKAGVVQVDWEPPPYVVGQLHGSANVSLGNTVMIGHLRGAAGDVFAHLDRLKPGDEITATSRGLDYDFVVSQKFTRANTDSSPTRPTDTPRLTLMTCAGVWNPLTQDYSQRLWVVAEPPDLAKETIAAEAEKAAAAATATATAQAQATATAAAEPTPTPEATPIPTVAPIGEIGPLGGLGNTWADLTTAYGQPRGESGFEKPMLYQKGSLQFLVRYSPDPPRASLIAETPPPGARLSLPAAMAEARKLLPSDTHARASAPEGNDQLVAERLRSDLLGRVLSAEPGDFLAVYAREKDGRISRIVVGLGDDPGELLRRASE